ncbi:alpha/beta hydrolase [Shewanella pneumatophori]|uniref:Alpha/beta hydrolase n=1 Tax=Shewanella pneumatophori TaxID=314092 RepID=A0A9X1Z815_9GAMM|nr:alpha/beta hydrolase [Shewanella pneumatophori]MCL1137204.1 alpha/beta hydrolase [Shewanella pneumatophori]
MRGIISPKLEDFLTQANNALAEAKRNKVEWTPALIRGNLDKLAAFMSEAPELAFVEDRCLDFEGRELAVRAYSPAPNEPLSVLLHFHGGGHMCGSVELYDPISRQLAKTARCVVICVEYRLAPEHPYPAGIHDCQHALINYKKLLKGVAHNDTVTIMGDSAGGAICTTLSMNSLKNSDIKIDKQILIYPSVDYTMSSPSIQSNGCGFLLEQDKIRWYFQQYFSLNTNENVDSTDESELQVIKQASPLYGPFSNKMPETLIFTAGCDPLRDEGLAYAHALHEAGVKVSHHQFDGLIHAYMLLQDLVKEECQQTYQQIADFMLELT